MVNALSLQAQTITLIRHFDTWDAGIIKSTDAAGIAFHPPSGNLYIADSEINENPQFEGNNIFETTLLGNSVIREIASNNTEPTGITFNEFDGFFYVSNDITRRITRYDFNFNELASVKTSDALPGARDPEGITSDPTTGFLYVADGQGGDCQVLIYNASLVFQTSFSVISEIHDPEGIAFDPLTDHLFLLSSSAQKIFEYTLTGTFIQEFDISGFIPAPQSPQGITFAPTSDPNDDPNVLAVYIADAMVDNFPDGRIYEAIITQPGPAAEFVGTPLTGFTPLLVSFTEQSIGNITSYSWDFGDGGTSSLQNPTYTYTLPGNYTVSLTVIGPDGNDIETKVNYITVTDAIPFAEFSASPPGGVAPLSVSFTDLSTGNITSYNWNFGDGGTSATQNPTYIYTTPGTFTVSLTVTGPAGSDFETKIDFITVADPGSQVTVSFQDGVDGYTGTRDTWLRKNSQNSNFGNSLDLDVDGSPDESTLLLWDVTSIPPGSSVESVEMTVNVINRSNQAYEIYEMKRPWIENQATWNQYASGQSWQIPGADGPADRGSTVLGSLLASSTGPNTLSLNASGIALTQSWVNDPSSNHGLIILDYISSTDGLDLHSSEVLTVINRPRLTVTFHPSDVPFAAFVGAPLSGVTPLQVNFTDQSTGDITNYSWNFGDGNSSTLQNPTNIYTSAGNFTVSLTVTGPEGNDTETKFNYITVSALPSIDSFAPDSGQVGTPVTIEGSNFTGTTDVAFNGVSASFSFISDNELNATVPSGATTGPITVTTPAGSSNSATDFKVVSPPGGLTLTASFDHSSNVNRQVLVLVELVSGSSPASQVGNWATSLAANPVYNVEQGSERLLLFVTGLENDGDNLITSVTYGGQNLTQAVEDATTAIGLLTRVEIWYLNEAGIQAAAGNSFVVTRSAGNPVNVNHAAATFKNVDQINPIGATALDQTSGAGPIEDPLIQDINGVQANSMVIAAAFCGNAGSYTQGITSDFFEVTDLSAASSTMSVARFPENSPGSVIATFQDGVDGYNGTRDTWLNNKTPTINFGTSLTLEVDGSPDRSAILQWDVSSIPSGSVVESVDITVIVTNRSSQSYEIYEMKRPWLENEATWNQFASGQIWQGPGANGVADRGSTVLGSIDAPSTGPRTVTLNSDGLALVQSWVDAPSSNHGLIILDYINNTNGLDFHSREASSPANHPKLKVTYSAGQTSILVSSLLPTPSQEHNSLEGPNDFALHPNFPNPFNASTVIEYALPAPTRVQINVYDVLGREVAILVESHKSAGRYRVIFNANGLPTGAYFVRMLAGGFNQIRRVMLIK